MENELKTPESHFSTSRYGRVRRPKAKGDYCADEVLSPMLSPSSPGSSPSVITRVSIEDDTPDESDYNSLLKIVSRPSLAEVSPCSPSPKVLKTYSNRKKNRCSLDSFSWTESVNLDVELEEKEIQEIRKSRKKLILTGDSEVQEILKEFEKEENNVSSSGLCAYKEVVWNSTEEISFVNDGKSRQAGELQSPIIDSSTPIKKEFTIEPPLTFFEGDLIWSRVGKHPLWPCMVVNDPNSNSYIRVRGKTTEVHVRFFADGGRRSWVNSHTSLAFHGRKAFDEITQAVKNPLFNRRQSHLTSGFKIPTSHRNYLKWLEAISEAESLMITDLDTRLNFFSNVITNNYRPTIELLEAKYGIPEKKDTRTKKAVTSTPKTEKPEIKRLNESYSFRERKIADQNSTSEIKKPVRPVFDKPEKTRVIINPDENWVKPRKGSLFKGIGRDRVCHICEKHNGVYKCRGNCGRYFHASCAQDPIGNAIVSDDDTYSECNDSICGDLGGKLTRTTPKLSLQEQIDAKMAAVMKETVDQVIYTETEEEILSAEIDAKIAEVMNDSDEEYESKATHVTEDSDFIKCLDCLENRMPACFICQSFDGERKRCCYSQCGRMYHPACLKLWPQTQWITKSKIEADDLICPLHACHTCVSDDPRGYKSRSDRLIKCTRCPTSYHASNYCIPAGSEIFTCTQLLCPKHMQYKKKLRPSTKHVNASWCFICSVGGSLICCETCPTSFHPECLKLNRPPEGSYICEECETGRLPLYDEVVWVKLGKYRWWPAQILFPFEVPPKILAAPHNVGEFVVRFFGSHDYYWINRGRVFLYQEGDTGHVAGNKSGVNGLFLKALKEAADMYKAVALNRLNYQTEINSEMKPPPYIKIKSNRPVPPVKIMENNTSINPCECSPTAAEPCGPDSDCLNRLLLTECNPLVCPAGTKCYNQQFQKRTYPALTPYKTSGRGWGLKTLDQLEKGQFVIEYVGEMINDEEYQRRLKRMHELKDDNYYFLIIEQDRMLDAGPKGNVARFMNHSCQPNCETQKWTVNGTTRIGLFALENITADTELTFNYLLESVGKEKKICKCGAKMCSGFIGVKVTKEKDEAKKKQILPKKLLKRSECAVCGDNGSQVQCQKKNCLLTYHLACTNLKKWPRRLWECPRHNCCMCYRKRTVKSCSKCPQSFCNVHIGDLQIDKNDIATCSKHTTTRKETTKKEHNRKQRAKKRKLETSSDSSKENIEIPKKKKWCFKINLSSRDVPVVAEEDSIDSSQKTTNEFKMKVTNKMVKDKETSLDTELHSEPWKKTKRKNRKKSKSGRRRKYNLPQSKGVINMDTSKLTELSPKGKNIKESDLPLKKRKLNESVLVEKTKNENGKVNTNVTLATDVPRKRVLRSHNESFYNEIYLTYGKLFNSSPSKKLSSQT